MSLGNTSLSFVPCCSTMAASHRAKLSLAMNRAGQTGGGFAWWSGLPSELPQISVVSSESFSIPQAQGCSGNRGGKIGETGPRLAITPARRRPGCCPGPGRSSGHLTVAVSVFEPFLNRVYLVGRMTAVLLSGPQHGRLTVFSAGGSMTLDILQFLPVGT